MKIIMGSSKVVQRAGQTQVATVLQQFGAEGSKEKQMRERLIIQGVVQEPSRAERKRSPDLPSQLPIGHAQMVIVEPTTRGHLAIGLRSAGWYGCLDVEERPERNRRLKRVLS